MVLLMLREQEVKKNLHEPVLVRSFERGWNVRTALLAQDAVEGYRHIFAVSYRIEHSSFERM